MIPGLPSVDVLSSQNTGFRETSIICRSCGATNPWSPSRRLMSRSEVDRYLALSSDQVQSLINTRQITVIRVKGEERIDSRDLDLLIETYKATAKRKAL
jgi:hypothetical protein